MTYSETRFGTQAQGAGGPEQPFQATRHDCGLLRAAQLLVAPCAKSNTFLPHITLLISPTATSLRTSPRDELGMKTCEQVAATVTTKPVLGQIESVNE